MADKDTPGEGHNEPDFKLARDIIKGDIQTLKDANTKNNGDLSAQWKRVEKEAGVNKRGAKFVAGLLASSDELQNDILRTVVGLCTALGIGTQVDLVDLAKGGTGIKNHSMKEKED